MNTLRFFSKFCAVAFTGWVLVHLFLIAVHGVKTGVFTISIGEPNPFILIPEIAAVTVLLAMCVLDVYSSRKNIEEEKT